MPDPIKPTQADREVLERIDDALGFLMDNEREIVLQAFALHAQQAREQALEEAARVALSHSNYGHVEGNRRAFRIHRDILERKEQCPC